MLIKTSRNDYEFNKTYDITGKTRSNMGWQNQSWQFVADSLSTDIKFYSNHPVNTAGWGMTLDNVSVNAVPEPLTILGAGSAIGFGVSFKRKLANRKNKTKTNS
ncbi:PEP-CTERM sorting domain-containing protein [Crocosphaera chwakensis]|uniref:PEP-CTERM protein-sorting domain-containing protein n=1 Tax=Crocosphaera chwakensis CCY0110 TaxID=391612 RepID=A3IQ82_9CHRO|nr:PEP-CTERM sorting domain-containing protein [Crocosphaera chwakensis]EAZ91422.1 hypothetical protein CY0110_05612 [Crocosphaera chwakensis CCY0110]